MLRNYFKSALAALLSLFALSSAYANQSAKPGYLHLVKEAKQNPGAFKTPENARVFGYTELTDKKTSDLGVVVFTDVEPDDRMAKEILGRLPLGREFDLLIVSSLLDSERKARLIKRQMRMIRADKTNSSYFYVGSAKSLEVYAGLGGSAESYPEIASSKAARTYQGEGKNILTEEESNEPVSGIEDAAKAYGKMLATHSSVAVLVLTAPDTFLSFNRDRATQQIDQDLYFSTRRYVMGGWVDAAKPGEPTQLRTTYNHNMGPDASAELFALESQPPRKDKFDQKARLYSSHMIKPSFGGGSINAGLTSFPRIIQHLKNGAMINPTYRDFFTAGNSWDQHLIKSIPPLAGVLGVHAGRQFTPADPVVILDFAQRELGLLPPTEAESFSQRADPNSLVVAERNVTVGMDLANLDPAKGYLVTVGEGETHLTLVEKVNPAIFERMLAEVLKPTSFQFSATDAALRPATPAFKNLAATFSKIEINNGLPIFYVTDIEGYWAKFERLLIRNPEVFAFVEGKWTLKAGYNFVFGGDAVGQGENDPAVVKALTDIAESAPDRAVLILGNRDLNKLRLRADLRKVMGESFQHQGLSQEQERVISNNIYAQFKDIENLVERLKFILKETMGEPNAFENRRLALAAQKGVDKEKITDQQILESYWEMMGDEGFMTKFLSLGQLGAVVDNSAFTHAKITKLNLFRGIRGEVLNDKESPKGREKFVRWFKTLQSQFAREMIDWTYFKDTATTYSNLVGYSRGPTKTTDNPASLTFSKDTDENGLSNPPSPSVAQEVRDARLIRSVAGHIPAGDIPFLQKDPQDQNGTEFWQMDTSRSDAELPTILIHKDKVQVKTLVKTPNGDLMPVEYEASVGPVFAKGDQEGQIIQRDLSGVRYPDGSVTISSLAAFGSDVVTNGNLLFRYGSGFSKVYSAVRSGNNGVATLTCAASLGALGATLNPKFAKQEAAQ